MSLRKNIAVITGGKAAEIEVSLKSAAVVIQNLPTEKYEVFRVDITQMPWQVTTASGLIDEVDLNTFSVKKAGIKLDFAYIAIHGTPAEDGKIQGYLDLLNIPYSACSVLASAITFDKDITKQLVKDLDILLAKSVLLNKNSFHLQQTVHLNYPLFVKPNKNGSSYGVSKVKSKDALEAAILQAFQFDDEVLVEEFIDGRELACGILQDKGHLICLPVTEIISENEFFDYEAKYLGKSKEITPAPLTEEQYARCQAYTKTIYQHLKLSGAVRIDYFLKGNDFYLLEVNTIPGLSEASILPQQAQIQGYTLPQFFESIIEDSITANNFKA